ncbi:hypothetical protein XELAEV_180176442mg, partial [Xenopus laevis]
MAEAGT